LIDIRNSAGLLKLKPIVDSVLEDVSGKVLNLLKEHIYRDVYRLEYFPNKIYHGTSYEDKMGGGKSTFHSYPTFQFLDAWKLSDMKNVVNGSVKELFYDWSGMDFDAETWLHGSKWGDARENLAEILNVYGYTSSLMVSSVVGHYVPNDRPFSKLRAPYYELFLVDLFVKGELITMFVEAFAERGFVIQKK
jgi:hypothetical protein